MSDEIDPAVILAFPTLEELRARETQPLSAASPQPVDTAMLRGRVEERERTVLVDGQVWTAERIKSLCDAIWPGKPRWEPTAENPQQDFFEALVESLRCAAIGMTPRQFADALNSMTPDQIATALARRIPARWWVTVRLEALSHADHIVDTTEKVKPCATVSDGEKQACPHCAAGVPMSSQPGFHWNGSIAGLGSASWNCSCGEDVRRRLEMSAVATPKVRAYEVGVKGTDWTRTVYALSAGKAKYDYLLDVRECSPDLTFKELTCHSAGAIEPLRLRRVAIYRGLPFVHATMRIEVEGVAGVVVDGNDSANFDVLFTEGPSKGLTLNCHPTWKTKYFDEAGNVLADFTGGRA